MKILEVRDGFIKFEADNSIYLSSFVQIGGIEKIYVAQVVQTTNSGDKSIALAKILFLYDKTLQPYDKTLPSIDSEIKEFTFNILNNSINAKTPIIAGETLGKNISIIIDANAFNKKMFMSIDDKNANNLIIRNLTKQFNNIGKKVLIIDTLGIINARKYTAGIDFKLPLNTSSLAFMYSDCLNDATQESKSLIIEIFKDLSDYSKTVPFLPFGALKTIIDEMVDKSHIFKLLVLKNKLAKLDKLGYFAKNKEDVDKLDSILNSKCSIVDLSKLDSTFQNQYLEFLYDRIQKRDDIQVFLELSNVVSKKSLKHILSNDKSSTTFVTHSQFKYLNDIKNLFDNFVITPSSPNSVIFDIYNAFLKIMPKDTYLITGEATNYIPLVSSLKTINEVIPPYEQHKEQETTEEDIDPDEITTEENIDDSDIAEVGESAQDAICSDADNLESMLEDLESETENSDNNETDDDLEKVISDAELTNTDLETELDENDSEEVDDDAEFNEIISSDEDEVDATEESQPAQIVTPEIIEPEIVEQSELEAELEASEEDITEPSVKITEEEILGHIEEKEEAVIRNAAEGLTPPSSGLFADDSEDSEDEGVNQGVNEGVNQGDAILESEDDEGANQGEAVLELEEDNDDIADEILDLSDEEDAQILQDSPEEQTEESDENALAFQEELLTDNIEFKEFDNTIEELEEEGAQENIQRDENISFEEISLNTIDFDEEEQEEAKQMFHTEVTENEEIDTSDTEEDNMGLEIEVPSDIDIDLNETAYEELPSENLQNEIQEELSDEQISVMPISDDNSEFEEITELNPDDANEDDIVIDIEENSDLQLNDEQIVKDVDKVFTTRKEDDISDSDLDLIDELNNDDDNIEILEMQEENSVLEELSNTDEDVILEETPKEEEIELKESEDDEILERRDSSTPIVPVYDADIPQEDLVMSDPIAQGDNVLHAKYGNGVVEKMIKYGNKTLFSINFDNVGRRLLDPTLTEIKKV